MIRVYRDHVVSALRELADREFQERVWLARDPRGLMSTFDECVESLFDDSGLSIELDAGRTVFPGEADDQLRRIDALVHRIGFGRTDAEIIADPRMERIRQVAIEILLALGENPSRTSTGNRLD